MSMINNTTDPAVGETIFMAAKGKDGRKFAVCVTVGEIREQHIPFIGINSGKVTATTFVEKGANVIWRVWDNGFRLVQHDLGWLKTPMAQAVVTHCLEKEFKWRIAPLDADDKLDYATDMRETLLILAKAGVGVKNTAHHANLLDELDRALGNLEMLQDLQEESPMGLRGMWQPFGPYSRHTPMVSLKSSPFTDNDLSMAMAFRQIISPLSHEQEDEHKNVYKV